MENPAEHLQGLTLQDDWVVTERIEHGQNHSGGNFSICYKVQRDGQIAFLKALDVSRAMRSPNPTKLLSILFTAFEYERELCDTCEGKKMDRVVKILGAGEIRPLPDIETIVPYLLFELAETTIREHVLLIADNLDNASLMRSLHNVAVAISQLHAAGIVHQDLKGSNVLLFSNDGASKVADLGRAEISTKQSSYFHSVIAGDPDYAPPDQRLDYVGPNWDIRRRATDLYHLGSLITFYYTQMPMTALYETYLPSDFKNGTWRGYFEQALPYLKNAFQEILEFLEEQLTIVFTDKGIVRDITKLVKFLCDPDPAKRGHPDSLPIDRYSMERFVTTFDVLAKTFERKLM